MIRTANISLSRCVGEGEGASTNFHPTLTNRRRIRPSFRLISLHEIPSQGHTCRLCPHHTRYTYIHIHGYIRSCVIRGPAVHVGPREKQSVPFTGNVYMDRLQSPSLPPTLVVPGFRHARHFTYAARCPRANISGANITLHILPLYGYPCGFQPELVLSSPVYRIPRVFDTHLRWQPLPRHLIEKPHTK